MSTERYDSSDLAAIKALQRDAYACAVAVAERLEPGVTEREAARRLGDALVARGASAFFHTPFAWFGDRAGFCGFRSPSWRTPLDNLAFARQFFPTERRLERGMCGILDVAPIRDGLCADIGYAFSHGEHAGLAHAMADLLRIRALILAEVRAGRSMRAVYRAVDAALRDMGYESAHALYPSSVLGHKIGRIPLARFRAPVVAGFDLRTYLYFGRQILAAVPGLGHVPLWNESPLADCPPDPGLWAIEPHVRKGDLGAKWEEILVIDDSDARWLDDGLPHVRAAAGAELRS